jgi:hypothetical protein
LTGNVAGPTAGTPPAVESQSPLKASLILATLDLLETPRLPRQTPELISPMVSQPRVVPWKTAKNHLAAVRLGLAVRRGVSTLLSLHPLAIARAQGFRYFATASVRVWTWSFS